MCDGAVDTYILKRCTILQVHVQHSENSPDTVTLWFVEAVLRNYDKLHHWFFVTTSLFSLFSPPSPQRLEDECGSKFQPSPCKANSLGPSYCLETIQQHSKGHFIRIKGASITKETPRGFHKGSVSQMLLTLENLT